MKTNEINIRDPYILLEEDTYYLYGTRSNTCWGPAEGFDCYESRDLENWEGPVEIFRRSEDFFATENFWAPECYKRNHKFYLITTLGAQGCKKGIYVLEGEHPQGPFSLYGSRLTPEEWNCIDGTLYFEDEKVFLIFSHSFEDTPDGDMCMVELEKNLSKPVGTPQTLFSAKEAEWARPVPFAEAEFGMKGDVYFTDGPCVFKEGQQLYMTWSSWGAHAYAVGIAVSESGRIEGPWTQMKEPVWPENGGHGMVFTDKTGERLFTLHYPNDKEKEHPCFFKLKLPVC